MKEGDCVYMRGCRNSQDRMGGSQVEMMDDVATERTDYVYIRGS